MMLAQRYLYFCCALRNVAAEAWQGSAYCVFLPRTQGARSWWAAMQTCLQECDLVAGAGPWGRRLSKLQCGAPSRVKARADVGGVRASSCAGLALLGAPRHLALGRGSARVPSRAGASQTHGQGGRRIVGRQRRQLCGRHAAESGARGARACARRRCLASEPDYAPARRPARRRVSMARTTACGLRSNVHTLSLGVLAGDDALASLGISPSEGDGCSWRSKRSGILCYPGYSRQM